VKKIILTLKKSLHPFNTFNSKVYLKQEDNFLSFVFSELNCFDVRTFVRWRSHVQILPSRCCTSQVLIFFDSKSVRCTTGVLRETRCTRDLSRHSVCCCCCVLQKMVWFGLGAASHALGGTRPGAVSHESGKLLEVYLPVPVHIRLGDH